MNILKYLNEKDYKIVKLPKGKTLFHEGDTCSQIGIIIEGQIKISSFLVDGHEVIYNNLGKEEIFGNNLIFSSKPYYKGDIIALSNSEIALIEKKQLLQILSNNKDFLIDYLMIQSNFSKTLNDRIKLLSISSAEERLYYYLQNNNKEVAFSSVVELAKQLDLSREATSRLLSKLSKAKKIIRTDKSIRLV